MIISPYSPRTKKAFFTAMALFMSLVSSWAAGSVTVNKAGTGDFTSIQAAMDSGASTITITDSSRYEENLEIGKPDTGGPAVTLTSSQRGSNRPVITPSDGKFYINSRRNNQAAGFGVFANDSVISNLIIEANPDHGVGAMMVMANNVHIENCLFRIAPGSTATLGALNPLLFFAQEGDGTGQLTPGTNPKPGGRDSNGCVVWHCEFAGVSPDANPLEPTGTGTDDAGIPDGSMGYLGEKANGMGTGQCSGYVRIDHITDGQSITVTLEGCYFHHCRDYGIFPTNLRNGAGEVTVVVRKSRFDAQGKFQVRGRGANVEVDSCVFTRSNQLRNGDGENSAVALQTNDGHIPSGTVRNSLFVNCGSANAQKGYYGGVNNHNADLLTVENCTFVSCLTGVGAGTGGSGRLSVSKSIFHQIGDNVPPAVDVEGITIANDHEDLVNGLYPVWKHGLDNFGATKWSGVFNRYSNNDSVLSIDNCLVGAIDTEDTRTWDEAITADEVTGSRLFCGFDDDFEGEETVTRGTPVFVNTDPDQPNPFQLAPGSPGAGLGANLAPEFSPVLSISRSGNTANISWDQLPWLKGIALKSTPSVDNRVWTAVSGVANNFATVNIGSANQYFALMKE